MSRNDLAGGAMEGPGDRKVPQLETATHVIDEYLQYLDGDRRDAPSLNELDQDELPAIEVLIDLLTASYDAGTPGAPPLGEDRVLTKLRRDAVTDKAGVKRLMEVLPDEPIVLGQAFAYLQDTRTTPDDYLHRWVELIDDRSVRGAALAALRSPEPGGSPRHPRSRAELRTNRELAATRWLSLDYLWRYQPGALALLKVCAFMAPGEIPSSLFTGKRTLLPGILQTFNDDPAAFDSALRALRKYFLATEDLETLLVDPIVQALVRDSLDRRERQPWASAAVRLLDEDFPAKCEDPPTWPACAQLLPHALASAGNSQHRVMAKTEGSLLHRAATYLLVKPEFQAAKEQFQRAVDIRKAALGDDHPEVANSLDGLGLTLRELWDLPEARNCFLRALAIRQAALGRDHPEVAITLDGLGLVARDLNRPRAARKFFKRSLKITRATYGPEHHRSATVLNNLGLALRDLGDLGGAMEQFELALDIRRRAYPPRHPKIGTVLHNLGLVFSDLGDLRRAGDLFERALFIHGAAYGWGHPRSAAISDNLSHARSLLGEHPQKGIARRADSGRPGSQRELASALGDIEEAVQQLDGVDPAAIIVRQALRDVSAVVVPMRREGSPKHVRHGIAAVDVARVEVLRPPSPAA